MRLFPARSQVYLVAGCLCAAAVACGIGVQRDFSSIPPGQVGFDDLCSLQDYFDTIDTRQAAEPTLVSAVDIEGQTGKQAVRGGKNRYAFETEFQLKHLRRILNQNWKRLPDELATAKRIDLEVHWSERSGVKRVVTDSDAEVIFGQQSFPLPYQICLSELLYGEPLYRQRREIFGLPLPSRPLLGDAGIGNAPGADAGTRPLTPGGATLAPAATAPAPAATPARTIPDAGSPDAAAAGRPERGHDAPPVFKTAPPAR